MKSAARPVPPHARRIPHPARNGNTSPRVATSVASGPTRSKSASLTSSPILKSKNSTPRSESARIVSLGATQFNTLGPMRIPARISPAIPGRPMRSRSSEMSLAEPKTMSMASGSENGTLYLCLVEKAGNTRLFVVHGHEQQQRSEEHTSELQSPVHLVCRLLLEKKKKKINIMKFLIN